jgi:spore maturation protein B
MMHQFSTLVIPFFILFIIVHGLRNKVAVYEVFVNGAQDGFQIAVKIIPYLVAMLFAIAMFRASGALDVMLDFIDPVFSWFNIPPEVLPMAIIRPLTGSGSLAVLSDLVQTHGEDSMIVKIAATMYGSTETTFYVLAVYFGAVNIGKTRYAVQTGLLADAAGFFAAVAVCYWLF